MKIISTEERYALGLPEPSTYKESAYRLAVSQPQPVHAMVGEVLPLPYARFQYRYFERQQFRENGMLVWRWIEVMPGYYVMGVDAKPGDVLAFGGDGKLYLYLPHVTEPEQGVVIEYLKHGDKVEIVGSKVRKSI